MKLSHRGEGQKSTTHIQENYFKYIFDILTTSAIPLHNPQRNQVPFLIICKAMAKATNLFLQFYFFAL